MVLFLLSLLLLLLPLLWICLKEILLFQERCVEETLQTPLLLSCLSISLSIDRDTGNQPEGAKLSGDEEEEEKEEAKKKEKKKDPQECFFFFPLFFVFLLTVYACGALFCCIDGGADPDSIAWGVHVDCLLAPVGGAANASRQFACPHHNHRLQLIRRGIHPARPKTQISHRHDEGLTENKRKRKEEERRRKEFASSFTEEESLSLGV